MEIGNLPLSQVAQRTMLLESLEVQPLQTTHVRQPKGESVEKKQNPANENDVSVGKEWRTNRRVCKSQSHEPKTFHSTISGACMKQRHENGYRML